MPFSSWMVKVRMSAVSALLVRNTDHWQALYGEKPCEPVITSPTMGHALAHPDAATPVDFCSIPNTTPSQIAATPSIPWSIGTSRIPNAASWRWPQRRSSSSGGCRSSLCWPGQRVALCCAPAQAANFCGSAACVCSFPYSWVSCCCGQMSNCGMATRSIPGRWLLPGLSPPHRCAKHRQLRDACLTEGQVFSTEAGKLQSGAACQSRWKNRSKRWKCQMSEMSTPQTSTLPPTTR
jgi:hypothetical protein